MEKFISYFILLLIVFVPVSHVRAAEINLLLEVSCESGTKMCKALIKDKPRYKRCLELVCSDPYLKQDEKDEKQKAEDPQEPPVISGLSEGTEKDNKTCEVGLRKCNALRNESLYYWGCMKETCKKYANQKLDSSCARGHQECKAKLQQYRTCSNLICKNPIGSFRECDDGRDQCGENLTEYWNCVTNTCLGDVSNFRNPNLYKDDSEPEIKGVPGVAERFKYPPHGISMDAWRSSVPLDRRYRGSSLSDLRCSSPNMRIRCSSEDVMSCICEDGTRAEPKKEAGYYYSKAVKRK